MKKTILIGFSGHAKVVVEALKVSGGQLRGYIEKEDFKWNNYEYLGSESNESVMLDYIGDFFHIAIGNNIIRKNIVDNLNKYNLNWQNIIHSKALLSENFKIGKGNFISVGAIINPYVNIGNFNIINSNALLEHDSSVGNFCHIAPRSTICGGVKIEDNVLIGAGAIIIENINICSDVIIGAGAVVVKDILEPGIYMGLPAKSKK